MTRKELEMWWREARRLYANSTPSLDVAARQRGVKLQLIDAGLEPETAELLSLEACSPA